jgi:hypothetical protein
MFLVISCLKKMNPRDRTNSSVKVLSIIIFDTTDFIQKWGPEGRGASVVVLLHKQMSILHFLFHSFQLYNRSVGVFEFHLILM